VPGGCRTAVQAPVSNSEGIPQMDIDPRGPRFGALITMVVFAVVLVTGNVWLLVAQALVFAVATVFGMRNAPYGLIYRWLVRPRLGPPEELEPEAPPRFAQSTGLLISLIGIIGYAAGITPLGMAAASAGLLAAFLNGVFGLCLGCEMYLLIRRIWPARHVLVPAEPDKEVSI
jgi:hypothetical protein